MKALDTNVLVRFLMNDDEAQAQQVYRLFKTAEAQQEPLLVPLLVVLELFWVLESAYRLSRGEILEVMDDLLLMPILVFENRVALHHFLAEARNINADLSDLLIAHSAQAAGAEVTSIRAGIAFGIQHKQQARRRY